MYTTEFTVSFLKHTPPIDVLTVNNEPLQAARTNKRLGFHLTSDLKWSAHMDLSALKQANRDRGVWVGGRAGEARAPPLFLKL